MAASAAHCEQPGPQGHAHKTLITFTMLWAGDMGWYGQERGNLPIDILVEQNYITNIIREKLGHL